MLTITAASAEPHNSYTDGAAKRTFKQIGTFLYETPMWVAASAVAGFVLLIFHPMLALPFITLTASTILTRLVVKVIESYNPQLFKKQKEQLYEFQKKHYYLHYVAAVISLITTAFFPLLGLIGSLIVGVYVGIVVEIDINKYKQNIHREKLKHPIFEAREILAQC